MLYLNSYCCDWNSRPLSLDKPGEGPFVSIRIYKWRLRKYNWFLDKYNVIKIKRLIFSYCLLKVHCCEVCVWSMFTPRHFSFSLVWSNSIRRQLFFSVQYARLLAGLYFFKLSFTKVVYKFPTRLSLILLAVFHLWFLCKF